MESSVWDLAIIGGGAAGLTAALIAKTKNPSLRVILLYSHDPVGSKLLMAGGGRCNITHSAVSEKNFYSEAPHLVRHALRAFTVEDTHAFFDRLGVKIRTEIDGRCYPQTDKAKDVVDALWKAVLSADVCARSGFKAARITKDQTFIIQSDAGSSCAARRVILAAGGASYPATGSDGSGYKLAQSFGHTILGPWPALTALRANDTSWSALAGVSLPAKLFFYENGKKSSEDSGSFLFTHDGFSGPVALNLSRCWEVSKSVKKEFYADFIPAYDFMKAQALISEAPRAQMLKNVLKRAFDLPGRFVAIFLIKKGVSPDELISKLHRHVKKDLLQTLKHYLLPVAGVEGFEKAEVTAGGVPLTEVHMASMESKKCAGLYFAGEILDADGRVGGYNLQWAWSTAAIAADAAGRSLK